VVFSLVLHVCVSMYIQPIADRVPQHLELISKNSYYGTRRTRILLGFIIYYLVLIVNPMGRILVRKKSFRDNLEMQCHPICSWLYKEKRKRTNQDVTIEHTGWRRLIGCLKLQTIFRKRATNYRALLRKMTCKIRHLMTLRHPVTLHYATSLWR